jgi:hypothetical protein
MTKTGCRTALGLVKYSREELIRNWASTFDDGNQPFLNLFRNHTSTFIKTEEDEPDR